MSENLKISCRCECGKVAYEVPKKPLMRVFCHCSICQKFNDAAYADISVYKASDINQPDAGLVDFDTYRPPPNVQRGKCASCAKPAIEVLETPLFPNLVMVPNNMLGDSGNLTPAKAHVFYEGRVEDAKDALPKHSGYLKSQLAFAKHLLVALVKRA